MKKTMFVVAVALASVGSLWFGVPAAQAKTASGEVSITSKSPQAVTSFKAGRDLLDNSRIAEAMAEFKKAIELDPGFALAHVYLGAVTPGSEGLKESERAAALATKLPASERMIVQAMVADAHGQDAKARETWKKLAQAAPGDWHAQLTLGDVLSGERKWDQAAEALEKASKLNPKAGVVYNSLGYAYLNQGKNDQAIEAFKKYSALRSDEPNPYDSLAEAQMAAGQLDEAEASFRKALEVSPQFYISWAGVAQTKFLRNDWAGGREALDNAKAAADRPVDKDDVAFTLAWSQFGAGKMDEAQKTLDALEQEAQSQSEAATYAYVAAERGAMFLQADKPDLVMEQAASALERGQKAGLSGGEANGVRRAALTIRAAAEARLGKLDDAAKTLALLEAEVAAAPGRASLRSRAQFARGELALSRGDTKAAAEAFGGCLETDSYAHLRQALAQEKSGDLDGAAQTRKKLLSVNRRDAGYLYVHSQLAAGQPMSKQE